MKWELVKNLKTKSLTWICENLPCNLTLYEEKGRCKKKTPPCKYYEKETSICKKQTYTPTKSHLECLTA